MISVLPPLEDDLLVHLFHKGARIDWTSSDFAWEDPPAFGDRQRRALARMLTPVFLGEQTAMLGAASVMGELARAGQTTAQLYLASFIMDEARHFEALARLYRHLGHHPVRVREMPEMLRYHHRLRQGDKLDWVWGILISDIFARHFYHAFVRGYPDAVIGRLSQRIIVDEGRHQAFAEQYIRRALPVLDEGRRRSLLAMRDELLTLIERMHDRLRPDTDALHIDGRQLLQDFVAEVESRVQRLGLNGNPPPRHGPPPTAGAARFNSAPGADAPAPTSRGDRPALEGDPPTSQGDRRSRSEGGGLLATCAGCVLALFCAGKGTRAPASAAAPA